MAGKGILLGEDDDILVRNKSLVIGDTEMQEVAIILQMNQGEQKFEPLIGPDIIQLTRSNKSRFDIEKRVKVHLARDGKNYEQIKNKLKTIVK